jgi:hypothetical protein
MSVLGTVAEAVIALVPEAFTYPVRVAAPVPPDATAMGLERPLIVPPVMATAFAFWIDMVPRPVMSVLGMLVTVVNAVVPEAFRYPAVKVAAPVPPLATPKIPDVT